MAIGLLGGSFNPAHDGHCYISEIALKRLGLSYVWWLVSPQNPLKATSDMSPLDERLAGARAAAQHPRIVVTDIERALATRYTADTVAALERRFPYLRFVWLMGSDNLVQFHRWKDWQEIARRLPIAVILRPGTVLAPLSAHAAQWFGRHRARSAGTFLHAEPPALIVLDGPRNAQSATSIRAAAKAMAHAHRPC